MNKKSKLFGISLIILLFLSISTAFSQGTSVFPQNNDKKLPNIPNNKVSAEEENIDSFDVNPKGGRWSVTDTVTDDTIIDSNLRVISSTNDTSSTSQYFAQRGLTKSDAKYEYRYKTEYDGDNTSEYFRDQLGDSMDFEEGDTEGIATISSTLVVSQGILEVSMASPPTLTGIRINNVNVDNPYLQLEIRVRTSIDSGNNITIWLEDSSTNVLSAFNSIIAKSSIWTTYLLSFSDSTAPDALADVSVIALVDNSDLYTLFIDYVKIIGNYDYATHDNQGPSDTWDWEDSLEYFFDTFGNVSDFLDGTTEDWTGGAGDTVTNSESLYLHINSTGSTPQIDRTGLSIVSATYNWMTIEFFPNETVSQIDITDGSNNVCTDSTGWSANEWSLFSCDLGLDGDWTGTETDLSIVFTMTADSFVRINLIYLYDTELGDLEGFDGQSSTFNYTYVDPEGFLKTSFEYSISSPYIRTINREIDTSKFDTLVIRAKIDVTSKTLDFRDPSIALVYGSITVTSVMTTYTVDLSADSDWTGLVNVLGVRLISGGTERVTIDYILLLKSSNETANDIFTIGLYDQDNSVPLLNVTQHFWNNSLFQWRVYLMDSLSNIVSYFYSSNRTYSDVYYRAKVSYNVLQSELTVEVQTDGSTRIFKVEYPDDFTSTGVIPQLFAHEKSPDIFFSTYTPYMTASETWIDFIEAPFKENEWRQVENPSDTDWLVDSPLFAKIQDNIDVLNTSTYRKNIPFLDVVSGKLTINISDSSAIAAANENWRIRLLIYGVDADDGELHILTGAKIAQGVVGGSDFSQPGINDEVAIQGEDLSKTPFINWEFATREGRSRFEFSAQYSDDESNFNSYVTSYVENNVSNIVDDASQEFVVEINYLAKFTDDVEISMSLIDFALQEKGWFEDIGNALGGIVDIGGNIVADIANTILKPLFDFLATIVRFILSGLNAIVTPLLILLQIAMEVAITGLGTLLDSAIAALEPLLTLIEGAIDGLITFLVDIADEIIALATTIWTAFLDIISDVLDELVPLIGQFINDIIDDFLPFLFAVWDALVKFVLIAIDPSEALYDGLVNIVNSFSDAITSIISLFVFLGDPGVFVWIFIFVVAMVFTFTALKNQDPRTGKINVPGYVESMTHIGMSNVNQNQAIGFTIFIPLLLILYIVAKILISEGVIPDIFGALPI